MLLEMVEPRLHARRELIESLPFFACNVTTQPSLGCTWFWQCSKHEHMHTESYTLDVSLKSHLWQNNSIVRHFALALAVLAAKLCMTLIPRVRHRNFGRLGNISVHDCKLFLSWHDKSSVKRFPSTLAILASKLCMSFLFPDQEISALAVLASD